MKPASNININPADGDERAKALIALIDGLIEIVNEENVELAKGLPASRLKQVDEKNRLANLFEQSVAEAVGKTANLNVQDRVLREQLMERILRLRAAMDENVMRLRAAIEASNRRIEAIMQAIREQLANVSPYGASGRRVNSAMSYGTNVRA
ncbi:flagellar basal-body protein FlbY [Bradyrhizobium macuxiense]|uniref:Flagellar basal-body protein FlbY n=1 Tax=Bradyrhizobium macuxiense TaxID=1755647 RepID=A0A120FK13_9BRAD|nr:flagellar basal-body protein FlbY [Bradyrhizobium macuxiense]KWV49985.1 flagellar basal-body protein FlbY [Bradyrhizobium macuxiense]